MNIPTEFAKELATFPVSLRALIEAELAAGNSIAALEHGFPAAPCGASVKLAHAVDDARRKSAGEVRFYARNNFSHAGEFTTAERHFFVLEPPLAPPPEPDMDFIRSSLEPKPDPLVQLADRRAGSQVRYGELADAALKAEVNLDSVGALQQAIVAGLKRGGSFATSHKEGGTNIFWRIDRFVRSDYGDNPDQKDFKSEAEFLQMLRQFCHWDVSRHAGKDPLSDFDLWKLILRRLRTH